MSNQGNEKVFQKSNINWLITVYCNPHIINYKSKVMILKKRNEILSNNKNEILDIESIYQDIRIK